MATVEARMIRAKLIQALERADDWMVVAQDKIVRQDGLWVLRNDGKFHVGSSHHSVPQATLDDDAELRKAWFTAANINMGVSRQRRPIFDMLDIPAVVNP
jgi:hypothetical protein